MPGERLAVRRLVRGPDGAMDVILVDLLTHQRVTDPTGYRIIGSADGYENVQNISQPDVENPIVQPPITPIVGPDQTRQQNDPFSLSVNTPRQEYPEAPVISPQTQPQSPQQDFTVQDYNPYQDQGRSYQAPAQPNPERFGGFIGQAQTREMMNLPGGWNTTQGPYSGEPGLASSFPPDVTQDFSGVATNPSSRFETQAAMDGRNQFGGVRGPVSPETYSQAQDPTTGFAERFSGLNPSQPSERFGRSWSPGGVNSPVSPADGYFDPTATPGGFAGLVSSANNAMNEAARNHPGVSPNQQMAGFVENYGPHRPDAPNRNVTDAIREAVAQTFGPDYTVDGRSGKGNYGAAGRHPEGLALDFDVLDPDGKKVTDKNMLSDLAANFAYEHPTSGTGLGKGYMADSRMHFDLAGKGGVPKWDKDMGRMGYSGSWGMFESRAGMRNTDWGNRLQETLDYARAGYPPSPFYDPPTPFGVNDYQSPATATGDYFGREANYSDSPSESSGRGSGFDGGTYGGSRAESTRDTSSSTNSTSRDSSFGGRAERSDTRAERSSGTSEGSGRSETSTRADRDRDRDHRGGGYNAD